MEILPIRLAFLSSKYKMTFGEITHVKIISRIIKGEERGYFQTYHLPVSPIGKSIESHLKCLKRKGGGMKLLIVIALVFMSVAAYANEWDDAMNDLPEMARVPQGAISERYDPPSTVYVVNDYDYSDMPETTQSSLYYE